MILRHSRVLTRKCTSVNTLAPFVPSHERETLSAAVSDHRLSALDRLELRLGLWLLLRSARRLDVADDPAQLSRRDAARRERAERERRAERVYLLRVPRL